MRVVGNLSGGADTGRWFASGALVDRVAALISSFPLERQRDLWSGVGLASSFAGGAERRDLELLKEAASPFQLQLAYGAAVAAQGHQDAGHWSAHTEVACEVYCGLSSTQAAAILAEARFNLPMYASVPAYEIWRERTQERLALEAGKKR